MGAVVTGAAGFIGRALTRALLDAGEPVVGIDRLPPPAWLRARSGLTVVTADLLAGDERIISALARADVVFHLAGCPGVRDGGPRIQARRHRDNVLATAAVLDAVPARTPVIVASSSSVYGGAHPGRPSVETDPLRPAGGYARSKVSAEALCAARLRAGARITVVRPFTVAGEGQRADMALARWIDAARSGLPLRVLGSLERTRDITDVRDVVRVLVALANRPVPGPVNVGTGVGHPLRALVTAVAAALGTDVATYVSPAAACEVADTLAGTRRLRRLVGFTPHTDLTEMVARQAAAQREPGRVPQTRVRLSHADPPPDRVLVGRRTNPVRLSPPPCQPEPSACSRGANSIHGTRPKAVS